ncbi:MAG: 16S rRNA (uracil(1498)-N(3))-methyltransferase, partial [Spirochaetales bacterium]|nr:16S rRNA (uracil(1498)-N(3))-methyltransferase [Spirochaetales bacterium]
MKRLVVDALPPAGGRVRLSAEQSRYLVRVRRMVVGSEIACTDGDGAVATARIVAVEGERSAAVTIEVVAVAPSPETVGEVRAGGPRSTLYTALLKGRKSDRAVRQATELGIDRIVPLLTEHCVSRPEPDDLRRKKGRWDQIAREATQQSGRVHVPEISIGESFAHLLSPRGVHTLSLAFYEKASA